jgi:ERCC4-type nuclease
VWCETHSLRAAKHGNYHTQVLIVDTAEPAEVRSELAKVNATMASAKLVSGDFAWLAVPIEASTSEYVSRGLMLNTGVERKRVADLVASIRDQRLRTQMCGQLLMGCSCSGLCFAAW